MTESDRINLDYVSCEILYELADLYKALALATGCAVLLGKAKTLETMISEREVDSP